MSRRLLPSVDRVLNEPALAPLVRCWGPLTVKEAVRGVQAALRVSSDGGELPTWAPSAERYGAPVQAWLQREIGRGFEPVFNLTGVLVHSNLGRSPLPPALLEEALQAGSRPIALEYDLDAGRRGDRERLVAHRLRLLTGAEAATVVNNNAAAVLLVLNTLALGLEVPVSRGELIEIGGSFRLPEIMERAGCSLREVGTTNRTHAADYEQAIGERTALLLKAHPSNYRIDGFAKTVGVEKLAAIGKRRGIPVCVDAGSGALLDLKRFGLPAEPTPRALLDAGAALVTFSGDKLLGGVQAGVVVGERTLIERINANPMKRALRLDKLALTLLNAVLKEYEDEAAAVRRIPLLAMLALPLDELERRGERVADVLRRVSGGSVDVVPSQCELGSGALPREPIESRAVTVAFKHDRELRTFSTALRRLQPAVLGRINDGRLWLDMRGADPLAELAAVLEQLP